MGLTLTQLIEALERMRDTVGDVQVLTPFHGVSKYEFVNKVTGYDLTYVCTDPLGDQGSVQKIKSIGLAGANAALVELV